VLFSGESYFLFKVSTAALLGSGRVSCQVLPISLR